ncbi:hypothetical protein JXB01_00995 [Candidatus Micrarchaeota archaeon]|nr:hypothetical protein [Candidatus Micrarchaeota archaeon]
MKRLLFLILLVSVSFSAGCENELYKTMIEQAGPFIGVAMLLSIMASVFAYMGGSLMNDPRLLLFSKDEIFHTVVSALMIVSAGGIIYVSCVAGGFFQGTLFQNAEMTECSIDLPTSDLALCALNQMESDARVMLDFYTREGIKKDMESTWVHTIYIPGGVSVSTGTQTYKKTFSTQYDMVSTTFVMPVLISITVQKLFFEFFLDYSISILLPMGLILRALPFTRQMGNFLVALGIAMWVFLPLLYAFNAAFYFKTDNCDEHESIVDDYVFGDCEDTQSNLWNVARLIPQAFFLPNITLAVFAALVVSITRAMKVIEA